MQKKIDLKIIRKLYDCIELLGGKSDILGIIGSWKSTMPDIDVLESLNAWHDANNANKSEEVQYPLKDYKPEIMVGKCALNHKDPSIYSFYRFNVPASKFKEFKNLSKKTKTVEEFSLSLEKLL